MNGSSVLGIEIAGGGGAPLGFDLLGQLLGRANQPCFLFGEIPFHIDLKPDRMTIETPDGFIQDELHGLEGLSPLTDENTGLSSLDVEAKLTILRIDGDR